MRPASITRRGLALGLGAAGLLPRAALAQARYPERPIRVIVPFGPGGLADVTMRVVGEKLTALLGQQVVVVNQPGAGGVTAAKSVLSSPADGYTLALLTNGTAISVALMKSLPFDPVADFVPVSSLGFFDFVLVTSAQSSFRTLGDFLREAKAKPGALNVGTIAVGSSQNLSATLLKAEAGIDFAVVAFRTTPDVLTATLRQDVHLAIDAYSATRSLIADGQLRALAITGPVRSPSSPGIPTVKESGVAAFEVTSWNALFAPAGTPPDIVAFLNAKVGEALADAQVKAKLLELGIEARGGRPDAIAARLEADIAKWAAVIERAGIARQ